MKTIRYSRKADAALAAMPAKMSNLIEGKIEQLAAEPEALANMIKQLRGTSAFRLRVGDYRVIYTEDLIVLDIINIADRKDAY